MSEEFIIWIQYNYILSNQERGWLFTGISLYSFLKFPLSQLKLFVKDEKQATGMFDSVLKKKYHKWNFINERF